LPDSLYIKNVMSIKVTLETVGASVMLAIPSLFLKKLKVGPGSIVDMAILDQCLVIRPISKPKYTLAELLAQYDSKAKMPDNGL
jgi:antitoxin ChpS